MGEFIWGKLSYEVVEIWEMIMEIDVGVVKFDSDF